MVYTTLKDRLGFSRKEIEGGTVRALLLKLAVAGAADVSDILFEPGGAVKGHFVLTLNSEILDNRKTGSVKVKAGDVLHVFPPISGG
jgi:molybdopterin converting factor small subunit